MRLVASMIIAGSLAACASEPTKGSDLSKQPATADDADDKDKPAQEENDSSKDAAADSAFCQDVTLTRALCGVEGECPAKTLQERTCAEGCPTAEFCYAEIESGDLYTLSCGWELENIEGRLRPCNEEEQERWSAR